MRSFQKGPFPVCPPESVAVGVRGLIAYRVESKTGEPKDSRFAGVSRTCEAVSTKGIAPILDISKQARSLGMEQPEIAPV